MYIWEILYTVHGMPKVRRASCELPISGASSSALEDSSVCWMVNHCNQRFTSVLPIEQHDLCQLNFSYMWMKLNQCHIVITRHESTCNITVYSKYTPIIKKADFLSHIEYIISFHPFVIPCFHIWQHPESRGAPLRSSCTSHTHLQQDCGVVLMLAANQNTVVSCICCTPSVVSLINWLMSLRHTYCTVAGRYQVTTGQRRALPCHA